MCAYHQFNFNLISLCMTSLLEELSLSSDMRITKTPGRISQSFFFHWHKMYATAKINSKD